MKTKEFALWKKSVQVGCLSIQLQALFRMFLIKHFTFSTAVVTWDREVYIVNNGTLPTVCGLLRSKPTGRNVTVNVSFEAGDMAGLYTLCDRVFNCYHIHCVIDS